MLLGIDGATWTAIGAVLAAALAGWCTVWAARGRNRVDASSSAMTAAINLINELQQERDGIRDVLRADIKSCTWRISHLEGRMSMLVMHIRRVEEYLRSKHLFDKAPQFDWQTFYARPSNLETAEK